MAQLQSFAWGGVCLEKGLISFNSGWGVLKVLLRRGLPFLLTGPGVVEKLAKFASKSIKVPLTSPQSTSLGYIVKILLSV